MSDEHSHLKSADPRAGFRPHRVRLYHGEALVFDEVVKGDFSADPAGNPVFNHDLVPALEAVYDAHPAGLRPVIEPVEPAPPISALHRQAQEGLPDAGE